MKILLIDPPYRYQEVGGARQNFRNVLNQIPSLGLAYLAAVARQGGHQAKIIDCTFADEYRKLMVEAKEFGPDLVGITATTPVFANAVSLAGILRGILPKAVFICGGPHPTACPEACLSQGLFDFLVLGEGEETFLELIAYLQDKRQYALEDIPGLAFKRGQEIVITAPRQKIRDLDTLPFPARDLLPALADYRPTPASYRRLPVAVIMTSRGCPSRCVFCDRSVFGDKFRGRSVANVMAEVEEVIGRYKAKEVRFFDDTFTQDAKFVTGICQAMIKLRPKIPWTCLTKVTAVNLEMLKTMRAAGCWQVLFGLESGDEYVLSKLGKHNTVAQNIKAVLMAKQAGLSIRADFLVGSPWETRSSLNKTIDFARSLPLDFAHFNKFVPLPGTAIYKDLVADGYKFNFGQGFYINNHNDLAYVPPGFSRAEYSQALDLAYKRFYLRPGYIWRRLLAVRTFDEIWGQMRGLASILSL